MESVDAGPGLRFGLLPNDGAMAQCIDRGKPGRGHDPWPPAPALRHVRCVPLPSTVIRVEEIRTMWPSPGGGDAGAGGVGRPEINWISVRTTRCGKADPPRDRKSGCDAEIGRKSAQSELGILLRTVCRLRYLYLGLGGP